MRKDNGEFCACQFSGKSSRGGTGDITAYAKSRFVKRRQNFSPAVWSAETPSIVMDGAKKTGVIWTEDGKILLNYVSNKAVSIEGKQDIAVGEFPATTVAGRRIFVICVGKDREKSSVKLFVIE